MKKFSFSRNITLSVATVASMLVLGCGGGGGTPPPPPPPPSLTASLFGTLGSVTKDAKIVVRLDVDGNGRFDDKVDTVLSTTSKNGSFAFTDIVVPATGIQAQVQVEVEGYAPVLKIVSLHDGDKKPINASDVTKTPIMKEVVKLPGVGSSARMSSVVQFGIRNGTSGLESFSRLVSLSQLKAEAADGKVSVEDGMVSAYNFETKTFPDGVVTVSANMQAFDSTNPDDISHFPGGFSGVGMSGDKSGADDEVGLASAAFDMIVLTDQNGEQIKLESSKSKLGSKLSLANCGSKWTRRITRAQADVILAWGDAIEGSEYYEVPIWSNDNSEWSWKYVGMGNAYDLNGSNPSFEVCIDGWGANYLNCDSAIEFTKRTNVCVNGVDDDTNPVPRVNIYGRSTNGQYVSGTLDENGHTSLVVTESNISKWSFTYGGSITSWSSVDITDKPIKVNSKKCTYELNISGIPNPFKAEIKVLAKDIGGAAAAYSTVSLVASYPNSYSNSKTTDAKGYATFKVIPNVEYEARYLSGTAIVTVNGQIKAPETEDGGGYANVTVVNKNVPPTGYLYASPNRVLRGKTKKIMLRASANDANGGSVTIGNYKVDGIAVTPLVINNYPYTGSAWVVSKLDVNSSKIGEHNLTAVASDGTNNTTLNATFTVADNSAPVISNVALVYSSTRGYNYIHEAGSRIKAGDYTISINIYDPDGDMVTRTLKIDGVDINNSGNNLADGSHTLVVTAKDEANATSKKTFVFEVGNAKPEVTMARSTSRLVDLNSANKTFDLYAYANDPDGDAITVKATSGTHEYELINTNGYFRSSAISLPKGKYTFEIVATDAVGDVSEAKTVTVKVVAGNQAPQFNPGLSDQQVNVNVVAKFECVAIDREGTRVSYAWSIDDVANAQTGTTLDVPAYTTKGIHTIKCTATDADGKSNTSKATLTIVDPNETGVLTINTGIPNLTISTHDSANGLKLIDTKKTDSDGSASFSVTTNTVSFSMAFDPKNIASEDVIWEESRDKLLGNAMNHCRWNDVNISECATADWCALSTADNLPVWAFNAAQVKDANDTNVTGASVDTDNDGKISKEELYAVAVAKLDKNDDGKLSWAELDKTTISVRLYVNVPVQTYTFHTDKGLDDYHGSYNRFCSSEQQNNRYFDINFTNGLNIHSASTEGSGWGSWYRNSHWDANTSQYVYDTETDFGMSVYPYAKDSDGNFDFSIWLKDVNNTNVHTILLLDQSEEDIVNNAYSYDVEALGSATLMDVNFTDDVNCSGKNDYFDMYINGVYKNMDLTYAYFSSSYWYNKNNNKILNDSRLTYERTEYASKDNAIFTNYGYYGDGTLKASYKSSDAPFLDLNITLDSNNDIAFAGADRSNLGLHSISLEGRYTSSEENSNGYHDIIHTFGMNMATFGPPPALVALGSLDPDSVFSADIASAVKAAKNLTTDTTIDVMAYQYKGKTAVEVLAETTNIDRFGWDVPRRGAYISKVSGGASTATGNTKRAIKAKKPRTVSPFSIKMDMRNIFR